MSRTRAQSARFLWNRGWNEPLGKMVGDKVPWNFVLVCVRPKQKHILNQYITSHVYHLSDR